MLLMINPDPNPNLNPDNSSSLEFAKSFCNVIDDSQFEGTTPCEKLKAMLGKLSQ
jgi:hypothetical protein